MNKEYLKRYKREEQVEGCADRFGRRCTGTLCVCVLGSLWFNWAEWSDSECNSLHQMIAFIAGGYKISHRGHIQEYQTRSWQSPSARRIH